MKKYFLLGFFALVSSICLIGIARTFAVDNEIKHMPESAKACFVEKIGQTALDEIISGQREATDEEKNLTKDCFSSMFKDNGKIAVKGDVKACIKKNLGKDIEEIGDLSDADRAKIESCFQDAQVGAIAFPAETKKCIASVLGESRTNELMESGQPTEAEKASVGPKCFGGRGGGRMDNVPAEAKSCIQKIMGDKRGAPTEEQKRQIDQTCFGGKERDTARQKMNSLSNEEKSCMENLFHSSLEAMGKLTADQERQAGQQCLGKRTPEQVTREESVRRSSDMTDAQKACVRERLGRNIEDIGEPNAEQETVIRACRTGNPNTSAAPNPTGVVPESQQTCSGNPLAQYKAATQQCVAERIGLTIATLCQGNFSDPNVDLILQTCKTNNGE